MPGATSFALAKLGQSFIAKSFAIVIPHPFLTETMGHLMLTRRPSLTIDQFGYIWLDIFHAIGSGV